MRPLDILFLITNQNFALYIVAPYLHRWSSPAAAAAAAAAAVAAAGSWPPDCYATQGDTLFNFSNVEL